MVRSWDVTVFGRLPLYWGMSAMHEVPWDATDELVASVRANVIRKLDEATDWEAALTDIYQQGQRTTE